MERSKILYALVTSQCNLSCPHCDVKHQIDDYNEEKFIEQLKSFDGKISLFGGEPSIYPERLYTICYSNPVIQRKIVTITTNLTMLDIRLMTLYQIIGNVGTSWNLNRFTGEEYWQWMSNIDRLHNNTDLQVGILITITDDLIEWGVDNLMALIHTWNNKAISNIRFEFYVGNTATPEYFKRADDWLCELYKKWDVNIFLKNIEMVQKWYYDCSNVFTLHPNGNITHGCPHQIMPTMSMDCLSCERAEICRPCQLQSYCSFPKKFAELVTTQVAI